MREQFTTDERGVSEVIGAILVFGLLIALMAIIQTQAIPAANQEVEFNHNQDVQGDLVKFHQTASDVANTGKTESVQIQTGTTYPSRLLFFSPSPPAGTISTSESREISMQNVSAIDPEVNHYLDGGPVTLDTRTLEYQPNYNYLEDPATTKFEYGILYNQHEDGIVVQNPGSVVDDTNINIQFMAGEYSRSSPGSQSLSLRPVSAPARPVSIEGKEGEDIILELPTDLPESQWQEIVAEPNPDTVLNVTKPSTDKVRIRLDGEKQYSLRMAGLGLEQGVEKPPAHYIVPADEGVSSTGEGQETNAAFEVRDRYNNPVSGVNVTVQMPDGPTTKQTNNDGRVVVSDSFDATTNVTAKIASGCSDNHCKATYRIQITDFEINPGGGVKLLSSSLSTNFFDGMRDVLDGLLGFFGGGGDNAGELVFSSDSERQISQVRMNFVHATESNPSEWSLVSSNETTIEGEIGGPFVSSPNNGDFIVNGETRFGFTLDGDLSSDGSDFFILTIVYDNGQRATYFVSPS